MILFVNGTCNPESKSEYRIFGINFFGKTGSGNQDRDFFPIPKFDNNTKTFEQNCTFLKSIKLN